MARYTLDLDTLSLSLTLDVEDPRLDLRLGLGEAILDALGESLLETALRQCDPEGRPWAALRPATARQKQSTRIGVRSGQMLARWRWIPGQRTITARSATWTYTADQASRAKARCFHAGRPPRPPPRPLFAWPGALRYDALSKSTRTAASLSGAAGAGLVVMS